MKLQDVKKQFYERMHVDMCVDTFYGERYLFNRKSCIKYHSSLKM